LVLSRLDYGNAVLDRAESVTENRNRYHDILKTETVTDVGIEKTENRRNKYRKKTENSVFADDDLLI